MRTILRKLSACVFALVLTVTMMMASPISAETSKPSDSLRIAVISDLHYYPTSFTGNYNEAYQNSVKGSLRLVGENAPATQRAIEMILEDAPDIVMVTGDLTNDGEKQSAMELAALLQKLEDHGIKVYVINGNHDINVTTGVSFASGSAVPVANITPSEFRQIFKNFGYDGKDDAVYYQSLNTANADFIQGGMSYMVSVAPGFKVLMLDSAVYTEDYQGQSEAMLSPELLAWAVDQLEQAQQNGDVVIGGMHHPLLTHFGNNLTSLLNFTLFETIDNNKIAAEQLANANLKYLFTGHMHGNDIAEYTTRKGNKIADIETAAIGVIGAPIRFATVTRSEMSLSSKSIDTINLSGQTIDYQDYLNQKLYSGNTLNQVAGGVIVDDAVTTLKSTTIYDLVQSALGINLKQSLEDGIISALSETKEMDLSVGKFKMKIDGAGTNDPKIHMWGTGISALLPDYDISIRNNIFVGLDDMLITQFNAVWLSEDAQETTRLERALQAVVSDLGNMVVHANGKTLQDLFNESIKASTMGAESMPEWVSETIADFKITLSRKLAKEVLIPSLKRNLIDPLLDEMYLDINKTFPSKSVYRSAIAYYLSGDINQRQVSLRTLLTNLAEVDVNQEINDLVSKYVDNDSDISMFGNPVAALIASQWTDSLGQDDQLNGPAVTLKYPDADPNAVADVAYKNISLGVGADQSKSFVTWYSTSAIQGLAQLAKKSDAPNGTTMPSDASKIQQVSATTSTTSEFEYTTNKASFSNLEPNTDYLYRVGNEGNWSAVKQFRTSSFGSTWGFVFSSDAQVGSTGNLNEDAGGWYSSLDLITDKYPEASFILHTGDQVENADSAEQYDAFLNHSSFEKYRFSTVVGNHDDGNVAYSEHFQNPNVQKDSGASETGNEAGDYWYTYNNVLFISLNANNNNYEEHNAFVRQIMGQYSTSKTWSIVTYHQSTYSAANHSDAAGIVALRNALSPVLSETGVDVVLMGHDHSYVRTYMMDSTTPQVTAGLTYNITDPARNLVLYITANSPASKHYSLKGSQQSYAAVRNQEGLNNISYIEVTDNSLRVVTYRTEVSDLVPVASADDMSILDEFTIYRSQGTSEVLVPTLSVGTDLTLTAQQALQFDARQGIKALSGSGVLMNDQVQISGTIDPAHDGSYKLVYTFNDQGQTVEAIRYITVTGNAYSVQFDSQGGSAVSGYDQLNVNSLIIQPENPQKLHSTFIRWTKDKEGSVPWNFQSDQVTQNTILYAQWMLKDYTIDFQSAYGETLQSQSRQALTMMEGLPQPEADGYSFGGWYYDASYQELVSAEDELTQDVVLYARWIERHESLVVFDSTNGEMLIQEVHQSGETLVLPIPVRAGYLFQGWNTQRDGTGTDWQQGVTPIDQEELVLYAQWAFEMVSVTQVLNNGTQNVVEQVRVNHSLALNTEISRSHYRFAGYTYDQEGKLPYHDGDVFAQDTTVYAQWIYAGGLVIMQPKQQILAAGEALDLILEIQTDEPVDYTISLSGNDASLFRVDQLHLLSDALASGSYQVTLEVEAGSTSQQVIVEIRVAGDVRALKTSLDGLQAIAPAFTLTSGLAASRYDLIQKATEIIARPYVSATVIEALTQEIDQFKMNLQTLMTAFTGLNETIETQTLRLSALNEAHFYGDSYIVYQNAVKAVNQQLKGPLDSEILDSLQIRIQQEYIRLLSQKRSVDSSGLVALLDSIAKNFKADNYTPITWTPFNDAVQAGQQLVADLDHVLQAQVDQSISTILDRMLELETTTDLATYIDQVKSILRYHRTYFDAADYTAESFRAFETALHTLDELVDRYTRQQPLTIQELSAAIHALEKAKTELVIKQIDPNSGLAKTLKLLKERMSIDLGDYTKSSAFLLTDSLNQAQNLLDRYAEDVDSITAEALNKAIDAIVTNYRGLKLQVLEDLEGLIGRQAGIDYTLYTQASVTAYQAVLSDAQRLIQSPETTKAELSQSYSTLETAYQTLLASLKPTENGSVTPSIPQVPADPQQPAQPDAIIPQLPVEVPVQAPSAEIPQTPSPSLPSTGPAETLTQKDSAYWIWVIIGLSISGLAVLVYQLKRQKKHTEN